MGRGVVTGHGDIRDVLLGLPHHPWADHANGDHYVSSDIFPTKHALLFAENAREPIRSVFEFGALVGYFLVTAADACPNLRSFRWIDPEIALPGSNELCLANLKSVLGTAGFGWWPAYNFDHALRDADVVHVDGDHSYSATLIDLTLGLAMRPRLLLVDDYQAIGEVRAATDDFARYMGLDVEEITTANGLAVIRP